MQALLLLDSEAWNAEGCHNHKALAGLQHIATESKVKGLSGLLWGLELSMMALVRLGE